MKQFKTNVDTELQTKTVDAELEAEELRINFKK
jgi:hypothetical protein